MLDKMCFEIPVLGYSRLKKRVPLDENPDTSKDLSFKPGVGQNIALYALRTATDSVFAVSPWLIQLHLFSILLKHVVMCNVKS